MPIYLFEPLDPMRHDRAAFSCGNAAMDQYLKTQARKDMTANVAAVVVLFDPRQSLIVGYFSLSTHSIALEDVPDARRLPRYPEVPTTLLGRLARDSRYHGGGIGGILLLEALKRSYEQRAIIASTAVVVDPIDQSAHDFYARYGFTPLKASQHRLYLPMGSIGRLLGDAGLLTAPTLPSDHAT